MIEQHYENVHYLQFSHYQAFPELTHGVFTRHGGVSKAPYASLNTSAPPRGGGDSFTNAIQNRQLALQALDLSTLPSVTLWQIHGADVVTLDRHAGWRTDWANMSYYEQPWTAETIHQGDALLSQEQDIAMALSFADCTPITVYDPVKRVFGIAHGGWRGTARGIVLATIEEMQTRFGCRPEDIYAGIAPAIGPCCYEVSQEVEDIFLGRQDFPTQPTLPEYRPLVQASAVFSRVALANGNSLRLDLQATNHKQLLQAGVLPEHIETMDICTGCHTDQFFSHRKEQGKTGRFVVIMALTPEQA
ncbi:peptidoglycan editing factor PgeF [Dictyobacter arantiisoli]|uniref:Purine nucleoside phosphorylase n=1 Tax=Dictyobacter arantiisoli TaxID=2014874 RepID=A0A5A5TER5_9CHLR|nr:peptidoglycan editing factor PgeF [Dictyobacter arantiisoli]GCF09715.1 laccase domain protein [Dictyobacter arantiisoli]